MDETTTPGSPNKVSPMETNHENVKIEKNEVVTKLTDETSNTKQSLTDQTVDQSPDTETELTHNVQPQNEIRPNLSDRTELGANAASEQIIHPVTNTTESIKDVTATNLEGESDMRDTHVEKSTDKTIEEGVSKAVTELKLDEHKEQTQNVERLQSENESKEEPVPPRTEGEKSDPEIADPVIKREDQMDVDPPLKTDVISSGVDCKEENEVVENKDEIPESKEEDAIDEAWKSDDFDLPPSDDEENYFSEPPPHVIVELYQKLDEGNILDLEWTCLGRRTPDEDGEKMDVEEVVQNDQEEKVDQPVEEDPTFDFDMDAVIENKVTPRRIPGFEPKGSGSAKKRVAKMDKVLNDIRRFSKINEEMEKTGDDALPPLQSDLEVTPQRPLGKFYIRRDLHQ